MRLHVLIIYSKLPCVLNHKLGYSHDQELQVNTLHSLKNKQKNNGCNGHSSAYEEDSSICHCQETYKKRLTFRKEDIANFLHQSKIASIVTTSHSTKNTFHCLIPGSSLIAQCCQCQVMTDIEKHLEEAAESTVNSFTAKYE